MRLSTTIRSLDTECIVVEANDRDQAKAAVEQAVQDGWELVTIGYMPLHDTVRASGIVRSTAVEDIYADGATPDEARKNLLALVPEPLRALIARQIMPRPTV